MKLKRFLINYYRVILICGACLGLLDAVTTNYLIAHGATEMNPIVAPIAGTVWLIVVKTLYPLLFLGIIELIKLRERVLYQKTIKTNGIYMADVPERGYR